jgi:zinc protease
MGHLLDILDKDELANQIDVVRNERRQRYDNVPYTPARFAMLAALYPEGHPYRYMTIGKHEDLVHASVDDVKNFFKTWYVPSNATLALVGDFDPADAKALVQKWFGTFPTSVKPAVVKIAAPTISSSTVTVADPLATLGQVTFAWHSPASYAPGDAELDIAASALGEDGAGRLFKSLVYKQLAQSVRVNQAGSTFSGVFSITVTLRSGSDLAAIEQIVADEVAKISREPLSDKEIARVVAAQQSIAIHLLEGLNSRANVLQEYNQFLGDPDRMSFDFDRYRKATPEQIRADVAQWLSPQHEVIVVTKPGAK